MSTVTLVEFLTARLDEDERVARKASHQKVAGPFHGNWRADSALLMANGTLEESDRVHIARHDPARVLREVEAKRAVLRDHARIAEDGDRHPAFAAHATGLGIAIRHLAAVYSDHPDYDAAWRL